MEKGHIFFIMWVSWAGKWTLIEWLKKQNNVKLDFLKSYVTRDKRPWEIEWNIYYFISMEKFKNSIKAWEFLEYKFVHNLNYYWTKKVEIIDEWINKWKKIIKEIDIEWLKEIFLNNPQLKENITSIFLDISKETLVNRIKSRWAIMSKKELNNRLESFDNEKKEAQKICQYIINTSNLNPEQVLEKVLNIINE